MLTAFTRGLNESQKKAVLHDGGPLLVLAGAGSGKTRVLTTRIARLVQEKRCKPEQILAVTFTNKAAREMKERVAALASPLLADRMTLSTFHSLGVKILREDGQSIGLKKSFTILDDHERESTLKSVMRSAGLRGLKNEDPDLFSSRISLAKNASIDPEMYKKENPDDRKLHKVYYSYSAQMLKRQCVDFDDLLLLPLQIFQRFPDITQKYRKRFTFISIDEFQDTNAVQMKLATQLAAPLNNLMVVGDDDQGIYSWRGADIANILSFADRFESCTTIVLDKNYRSTRQIFEGAQAVVARNRIRKSKQITAVTGDGDLIRHYKGDDEEDEAAWIAATIAENHQRSLFGYHDHAILVRTNALMRRFEEELRKKHVPYRVSGAMSFFERKEIKDILAYLRFFANPHDESSLERVLKVPGKGISPSTMESLDEFAALRKMSLWDAIERCGEAPMVRDSQKEILMKFVGFHRKYYAEFENGQLAATFRAVLTEIGYFELLKKSAGVEGDQAQRLENVEEMIKSLETFEYKFRKKKPTLPHFLQDLMLLCAEDNDEQKEQKNRGVVLMTFHKSKGLEFPVVFLAALDSEYIPSPRAVEEGMIDEERRLFYVGMTRARKQLFLTYPGTKIFRAKMRTVTPCPFLKEIPEEFLDGKLGERENAEKAEYLESFFKELKTKFGANNEPAAD